MLFRQWTRLAASRTFCTAGINRAISTPMIAMTTNNSIKVNPLLRDDGPMFSSRNGPTLRNPLFSAALENLKGETGARESTSGRSERHRIPQDFYSKKLQKGHGK